MTENKPIPFHVFLEIYNKANHECYIEYMRGAKALYKWLAFTDHAGIEFPPVSFDSKNKHRIKVPSALQGYESQELAKIVLENSFPQDRHNIELLNLIHDMITLTYIDIIMLDGDSL